MRTKNGLHVKLLLSLFAATAVLVLSSILIAEQACVAARDAPVVDHVAQVD